MRKVVGILGVSLILLAIGFTWGVWGIGPSRAGGASTRPTATPTPDGPEGAPTLLTGEGRLSFRELLSFSAHAVLWAGPEVGGQPLSAAVDTGDSIVLIYGACEDDGATCTPALQIQIYGICTHPPQEFLGISGRWENLRGAKAFWSGDTGKDLWVFTADVTISATTTADESVGMSKVAAELRPLAWPDPAPPYANLESIRPLACG